MQSRPLLASRAGAACPGVCYRAASAALDGWPLPSRHHLQCLSWHCSLQAVGFILAAFCAHQLLQPAMHRALAARACSPVTSVSTNRIEATIAISATVLFIFASSFPKGRIRLARTRMGCPGNDRMFLFQRSLAGIACSRFELN